VSLLWTFSLLSILFVWVLYPLFLWLLSHFSGKKEGVTTTQNPLITVIVAAHNESKHLKNRIVNIYESDYPDSHIEVVVASDGSTDNTVETVNALMQLTSRVRLVSITPQGGRSNAHNIAVRHCSGEILVFTDAETSFKPDFLRKIADCFQDSEVGFCSGVLKYRNQSSNAVTESAGFYWKFEYFLRELESLLGCYVFGSGACCAVHKDLYRDIPLTGDVDFTTPLDVVLQEKKCVHVVGAIAYDEMPESPKNEFHARVRMTAKNLYGTIQRWGIQGLIHHPIYTLVILLHKLGRWFTPFAMLALFGSNIYLLSESSFYLATFIIQVLFFLMSFAGYMGWNVPLAQNIYSFCLANVGFFVGVLRAVTGRVPKSYKPVSQMR
jgi:poly-beta-1,6-N-acetyl-D-glucosamine synthase